MHRLPIPGQPLLESLLQNYWETVRLPVEDAECGGGGAQMEGKGDARRLSLTIGFNTRSSGLLSKVDEPILRLKLTDSVPIGPYHLFI